MAVESNLINKFMEFLNDISNDSLVSEMDRICNSDANTYPIRDKAARVNAALDRYLSIAFRSDGRWNFDDINESSPPIDTQNIVSGTNRYKFSAFTETFLSLIRLEVLDSGGNGLYLIPEMMDTFGIVRPGNTSGQLRGVSANTFQELYVNAGSGVPTHYIKYGDFIYLRPNPNYSEANGLLAYFNRPASKFNFVTYTQTIADPSVFTAVAHGLAVNDTVLLQTDGALPTNFAVDTVYYVKLVPTADTFQLALTKGGTAIEGAGSQSGIHYFLETSKVPGVPIIHHPYLAKHAALPFLIEKTLPAMNAIAQQIQMGEEEIEKYFAYRDKDISKGMRVVQENNK